MRKPADFEVMRVLRDEITVATRDEPKKSRIKQWKAAGKPNL